MYTFSCKDCPKRYVGCHSNCKEYLRERAEYEQKRGIISKNVEVANINAKPIRVDARRSVR